MSNLYLISQDVNDDYDTYDSAVVVADSEQEAQQIHPNGRNDAWEKERIFQDWARKPEQVKVEYIGKAADYLKPGEIICTSFNAG